MKLNTDVYELKNIYNAGTESEYTTSDIISNIVKNKFTDLVPDKSLLICQQADDSPFNELFTCTEYRTAVDFDYTSKKCEFGIFPFIVLENGFARGCMDYSEAWDTNVVPITENYPLNNSQILTKYDYKKLIASIGFALLYNDNTYWYNSIDEFINNSDSMDFIGFNAITSMVVNFAYNGTQLNTTGYANSSGAIMLSENENWFHSSEGFLIGNYNWTTSLPTKRVVINHNNAFINTKSDKTSAVLIKTSGMTKKEIIDFLRSLTARLGYIFSDNREGVFGTGNTYLPEIINGVSTGKYFPTNNLENVTSDNLEWSDRTEIDTIDPSTVITDDIEPVNYGYFTNTTIGTLYALKNKLDLEKITAWLLTQTGKIDVAKNIVSLKEIPFPLSRLYINPTDSPIYIGGEKVTFEGNDVIAGQIIGSGYPTLDIVFADFNIPRLSNTFLDYSPYTKYELLLPFAPTPVILPDWCAGKNVKAIFLYDIYTASCQYVVTCNNERICCISGNFGIDKPLIAQNVALKDASRLSAQIGTASSVLGGVMSAATGNIGGIMSGAIGGVSSLSQMILSGKNNYMYTVGSNGDSTTVGLYHAAHLKITRTLSAETDGYLHTYGKPLCKMKKLSEIHGFTKCENVNTDGLTCSETEKQMIKQLLENGIYI